MTTFTNGPAAGQTLMLQQAPLFLRVVCDSTGLLPKWDALDHPYDKPEPRETLTAYRRVGDPTWMHVKAQKRSGVFHGGKYELLDPQPDEAVMRDNRQWATWVEEHE